MTLLKLNDLDPQHQRTIKGKDIRQFTVYTDQNEPIGRVVDALVDETERLCYLVVERSPSVGSHHVLLPPNQIRVDLNAERVYLTQLSKTQFTQLPPYSSTEPSEPAVSAPNTVTNAGNGDAGGYSGLFLEDSLPLESATPLEASAPLEAVMQFESTRQESSPLPQHSDPFMEAEISDAVVSTQPIERSTPLPQPVAPVEEHSIRLLEERLVVNSQRRKVGEVIVRKEIETHIIEVPVRREKLVVEQVSPEHKQLAIIDLKGAIDGVELQEAAAPDAHPVVTGEFSSIEAAIHLLKLVAAKADSGCEKVELTLVLKDASFQNVYQEWFRQYTKE